MKKNKKNIKFIFISFLLLAGCAFDPPVQLTPLEIQNIQSRSYDADKKIVFASVVSVFQDLGYTINSANFDTGFISAESAATSDFSSKFMLGISEVRQTKATAFIEDFKGKSRVRLNFVTSSRSSYEGGQTDRQDQPILNSQVYQNAFEKIANSIFVRTNE